MMSALRASIVLCGSDPDLTVGAIECRPFGPQLVTPTWRSGAIT
jgi:hypothetical protein